MPNEKMLDLPIVPVGNSLQCIDIRLGYRWNLGTVTCRRLMDMKKERNRTIKTCEIEIGGTLCSGSPEVSFDRRVCLPLSATRLLSQQAVALMKKH